MIKKTPTQTAYRCAYIRVCYVADALTCFGYRTDCPLYLKTNGAPHDLDRFHRAMDELIDKARAKSLDLLP
jgi:hypothetical protein